MGPPVGTRGEGWARGICTAEVDCSTTPTDGPQIVASTYEPLPSYRLITSNGPLILPKGLDEHLIQTLEQIDAQERKQE